MAEGIRVYAAAAAAAAKSTPRPPLPASMAAQWRAMLLDLGAKMWSVPRWRVLLAFYGSVFVAGTGVALTRTGKNARTKSSAAAAQKSQRKAQKARQKALFQQRLWALIKIGFPSFAGREAAYFVLYTILLALRVRLSVTLTDIGSLGLKCLVEKDWQRLFQTQSRFMTLCVPVAIINALMRHAQHLLALAVRERLTNHVHRRYLDARGTFFRVSSYGNDLLTTVDQRVTADLDAFSATLAELYGNLLKPLVEVATFVGRIRSRLGTPQLLIFLGYFAGSSFWLKAIMPAFGRLTAAQRELEGRFRARHAALLSNAEEIAFLRGGEREKVLADRAFGSILTSKYEILRKRAIMSFLDTTAVKHFGMLLSYEVMIPAMYLGREGVALATAGDRTAYLIAAIQYFTGLGNALNKLYQQAYQGFSKLAGMTTRVSELLEELERRGGSTGRDAVAEAMVQRNRALLGGASTLPPPKLVRETEAGGTTQEVPPSISLSGVTVFSPQGALLVRDLDLTIAPGQHLIVEGPNGAGKSSLLRTIGGLWPLSAGTLRLPDKGLVFVPQAPYVFAGTLRELLIYPDAPPGDPAAKSSSSSSSSDSNTDAQTADLLLAMRAVGLEALVTRQGGLDVAHPWDDILSGGERQRVAMARVLYRRPKFAFLDEATAAVSVDIEAGLVQACAERNITMISVSHRPHLREYHCWVLKLLKDGEGGWEVERIRRDSYERVIAVE